MKKLLILALTFFSVCANAELVDCGAFNITNLYVMGERFDTNNANRNMLLITVPPDCDTTKDAAFVRNDDPSYQGVLSMLLAAKMSNTPIRVMLDTSDTTHNAAKIEWVNFY